LLHFKFFPLKIMLPNFEIRNKGKIVSAGYWGGEGGGGVGGKGGEMN
jgi:hypothetical protein